jgi:hypothetical protein
MALGDVPTLRASVLERALPPALRGSAIERVSEVPDAPALSTLAEELVREMNEGGMPSEVVHGLVKLLRVVPHPRREALLASLLGEATARELTHAAIRVLGEIGTVATVPALAPLRDRSVALASETRALANDAILAIQARAGRREDGALALAEGAEGGLALAPETANLEDA